MAVAVIFWHQDRAPRWQAVTISSHVYTEDFGVCANERMESDESAFALCTSTVPWNSAAVRRSTTWTGLNYLQVFSWFSNLFIGAPSFRHIACSVEDLQGLVGPVHEAWESIEAPPSIFKGYRQDRYIYSEENGLFRPSDLQWWPFGLGWNKMMVAIPLHYSIQWGSYCLSF